MPLCRASRRRRVVATALALAAWPLNAAAQTPWRETVTVTAAFEPLSFDGQSRVVHVVTREQIARLPVSSLGEALALLAAVDVRSRGVDGIQTDFSIRGASFGQALVLVDGVRINDAQSGHHNGDIPLALDDVERIEVPAGAANIREVTTGGVELTAGRRLSDGGMVDLQYAWLDSDAPTLDLLSKYVLDVARHRLAASGSATLPGRVIFGGRLGITRRLDGREYTLLDARLSRGWGAFWLTADFKNLLNEDYEEIVGVAMPGRNGRIEIAWRR